MFVYKRPWHTRQALEALQKNDLADQSILYVYADGAKREATLDDLNAIEETRALVKSKSWCGKVQLIERESNLGLAENVLSGITEVVQKHGRVIVLEDDLITSPYFLTYCNDGLDLYENDSNVYAINGYQFPIDVEKVDTFLCPLATSSWGWATWSSSWASFSRQLNFKDVIQNKDVIKARFNIADYDYATMLNNEKSWAIKWYYSVFLKNGLGLFPTRTLVTNIGFDGSGEHSSNTDHQQALVQSRVVLEKKEIIHLGLYAKLLDYFKIDNKKQETFFTRIAKKISR